MTAITRPSGSNADEWATFLSEYYTHDTIGYVAVQIAEAIEESAKKAQICCDSYAAENQRFHDEIERLQAVVKSVLADIGKVSRENDRLRAGLQYILDDEPTGVPRALSHARRHVAEVLGVKWP